MPAGEGAPAEGRDVPRSPLRPRAGEDAEDGAGTRAAGLTAALVVALLALAHAWSVRSGLDHDGVVKIASHLFELLLAAGLVALVYAVGAEILERLGPGGLDAMEELVFGVAVGVGVLGTGLLVLGLAGLFRPWAVGLAAVGTAAIVRGRLASLPALVARIGRTLRRELGPAHYLAAGSFVLAALFLVLHAAMPPLAWDDLMYHLSIPRDFLERGRFFVPVDNLHVAFVGAVHTLYALTLAAGALSAPALTSALLALLLPVAIYAFVRRIDTPRTAALSAAGAWGFAAILFVGRTARVDGTVALLAFLAHAALYLAHREQRADFFYLSAALLGFAFSVKYQGGVYLVALAPFVAYVATRRLEGVGPLAALSRFAGIGLLVAAPWLIKNGVLLGSPVYPFLTDPLLPPWLADLWGQAGHPEAVGRGVYGALSQAREAFNLEDFFLAPEQITIEGEGRFYNGSLLFALLPLSVIAARNRYPWMWTPGVLYAAVVILPFDTTNLRYLIPAAPMLAVAGVLVTKSALARLWNRDAFVSGALLLVVTAALARPAWAAIEYTKSRELGHVSGGTSTWEYLIDHGNPPLVAYASITGFGERPLPPDTKVLMLFDARGFYARYLDLEVLQDNLLTNWPLLAPLAEEGCLPESDVTHVLVNQGVLGYYVERGLEPNTVRLEAFRHFASRCLVRMEAASDTYALYRIEQSSAAAGTDSDDVRATPAAARSSPPAAPAR